MVLTTIGELPKAQLLEHITTLETDDQIVETVEYCLRDCEGIAHRTWEAQGVDCFCPQHIHRSVRVTIKRWPEGGIAGETAVFG